MFLLDMDKYIKCMMSYILIIIIKTDEIVYGMDQFIGEPNYGVKELVQDILNFLNF